MEFKPLLLKTPMTWKGELPMSTYWPSGLVPLGNRFVATVWPRLDHLGIALHVIRRKEHAGLRWPIVHLRKVFAGSDRRDHLVLVAKAHERGLAFVSGIARATPGTLADGRQSLRAGNWSRCPAERANTGRSPNDRQQVGAHGLDAI